MATESDVVRQVGKLAKMYGRDMGPDVIAFVAEVLLKRLTPDQACSAISTWAENETRWPSPGQLIQVVFPLSEVRDEATELATRLRTAIARRGYTWESTYRYDGWESLAEAIQNELGDEALSVVERSGGWQAFCREWGGDVGDTAARAQLRGLCEVALKQTSANAAKRIDPVVRKLIDAPNF